MASHAQPRRIEGGLDPEAPVGKQRRQRLAGQWEWLPTRHVVGGEATSAIGDDTWKFNHPHVAGDTHHSNNRFAKRYEFSLLTIGKYGALTQLESGALTQNGAPTQYGCGALTQSNYSLESHLLASRLKSEGWGQRSWFGG